MQNKKILPLATLLTPPTKPSGVIDVWVLIFPHFLLLDATGPIQVFSTANDEATDAGLSPPYRIHLVAQGGGQVVSSSGVSLLTSSLPRRNLKGTTAIIAGGRIKELPSDSSLYNRTLLKWVKKAGIETKRCCSVCTGTFLLARAGLLDGRRAVTHWQDVSELRKQHPLIDVQEDAIYIRDGSIYTSAGISAGMDLALSLVEEDFGRAAALSVAKRMVLFLKRPGGQRQFSSELLAQSAPQGISEILTTWIRPRLSQLIDNEQMAMACSLSTRSLHRKLREEADITPAQLLAKLRMEKACILLEQSGMTVKLAARQSGYGNEYNLRRAFVDQLGVLPSEYQSRFS